MSEVEFNWPRKLTFDEYYDLLNELVSDPEAQKQFAIYDAECQAGRGDILFEEHGVAEVALFNFRSVGHQLLYKLGWPTYAEAREFGDSTARKYKMMLQSFPDSALTILRGGGAAFAPHLAVDIADRDSVRRLLELKMSIPHIASNQIYDLKEIK